MDTNIASPTGKPRKNRLKEADGILDKIWHEAMDSGLNWTGVGALIWDFIDSGQLSCDEADHWMRALSRCPAGYDLHVDIGRSWCAYCGSICSHSCYNCSSRYDLIRHPERFWFMEAQVEDHPESFCDRCWIHIGSAYGKHYGVFTSSSYCALGILSSADQGLCARCGSRMWSTQPLPNDHSVPCSRCYYTLKASSLSFEHLQLSRKLEEYYANQDK